MGRNHVHAFAQLPDVEVVALCDVDENLFPRAIDELFVKQGRPKPKTYTDLRKLYEDKDVDAVSIVTAPSSGAIPARRRWPNTLRKAGSARSIWRRASATSGASRSDGVKTSRCRQAFTTTCGSAPRRRGRSTATASIGRAAASSAAPGGGDSGYMATSPGNVVGNLCFGSKGYMTKNVDEWRTYMGEAREPGPTGKGEANHYAAFVNAIRDGDPAAFNANMDEAFYSCALLHLANISYRLGRSLTFDPESLTFPHDAEANSMMTRQSRPISALATAVSATGSVAL